MTILLIMYKYLFKFRAAEIQIDKNAMSVDEVIKNLRNMERCFRAAVTGFISLKIIIMVCYFMTNICIPGNSVKSSIRQVSIPRGGDRYLRECVGS